LDEAGKVLKEIEAKAKKKFLPIVGPHRGQILVEAIRKTNPKRVLEVGTFIGYSAILMAKELARANKYYEYCRPSNSEISSMCQANAFSSSGKKSIGETKNKNVPCSLKVQFFKPKFNLYIRGA
jgi:protein-L-isoaspartate O-methyltransferase